jgi:UDP-N-acetylmuramate dehydrogenase
MMDFRISIPLSDKTTFRIGGASAWYAEPVSTPEITEAIQFAHEKSFPVLIIGKGSNLLVSDQGWPGLTISTEGLSAIRWNGCEVTAQGGAMLDTVVRESIERGFAGVEELSGIPGTIGGAVIMNAGAFGACIADTIVSADDIGMDDLRVITVSRDDLHLGYRSSALQNKRAIVLSARLKLTPGDRDTLQSRRHEILEKRRTKQPLDLPNCGSVFKRPPGSYAGMLIEQAGLKGFRYGNVSISSKHANFIVNHGNGTAAEVRHLIALAQKTVFERSGVLLEPEVIFAGTFDEPLFTP